MRPALPAARTHPAGRPLAGRSSELRVLKESLRGRGLSTKGSKVAVAETAIPLHRRLRLSGASVVMGRERQQNDCLLNGHSKAELKARLLAEAPGWPEDPLPQ